MRTAWKLLVLLNEVFRLQMVLLQFCFKCPLESGWHLTDTLSSSLRKAAYHWLRWHAFLIIKVPPTLDTRTCTDARERRRPPEERQRLNGTALLPALNRKLLGQLAAARPRPSLVRDVLQACDGATLIRMRPVLRALEDGSLAWLAQHSANARGVLHYLALSLRAHADLLRPPHRQAVCETLVMSCSLMCVNLNVRCATCAQPARAPRPAAPAAPSGGEFLFGSPGFYLFIGCCTAWRSACARTATCCARPCASR